MDWIELGSSPPEEDCAQVGADDYPARSGRECRAWARQLGRALGPLLDGMFLSVHRSEHDFGTQREVHVGFNASDGAQLELALRMEGDCPGRWDDAARAELGLPTAAGLEAAAACLLPADAGRQGIADAAARICTGFDAQHLIERVERGLLARHRMLPLNETPEDTPSLGDPWWKHR